MTKAPSIKEALDSLLAFRHGNTKHLTSEHARTLYDTLAPLPPAGERREAIALALAEKWPGDYMQGDDECEREPNELAYETADLILASGLVQDEAGWRDISTAPKDGRYIVVGRFRDDELKWVKHSRWMSAEEACEEECGASADDYHAGWTDGDDEGDYCYPTHWMPLPAPPIRSARDGGAES